MSPSFMKFEYDFLRKSKKTHFRKKKTRNKGAAVLNSALKSPLHYQKLSRTLKVVSVLHLSTHTIVENKTDFDY